VTAYGLITYMHDEGHRATFLSAGKRSFVELPPVGLRSSPELLYAAPSGPVYGHSCGDRTLV
jgi:hypothetical protein